MYLLSLFSSTEFPFHPTISLTVHLLKDAGYLLCTASPVQTSSIAHSWYNSICSFVLCFCTWAAGSDSSSNPLLSVWMQLGYFNRRYVTSDNHSFLMLTATDASGLDPLIDQGFLSVIFSLTLVSDQGFSHEASGGRSRSTVWPRCLIWMKYYAFLPHLTSLWNQKGSRPVWSVLSACFPDKTGQDPDTRCLYTCHPKSPGRFYQVRPTPGPTDQMLAASRTLLARGSMYVMIRSSWEAWHPGQIPRAPSQLAYCLQGNRTWTPAASNSCPKRWDRKMCSQLSLESGP